MWNKPKCNIFTQWSLGMDTCIHIQYKYSYDIVNLENIILTEDNRYKRLHVIHHIKHLEEETT